MHTQAEKHDGVRCPRCKNYHRTFANFDYLCDRCLQVLKENYPQHISSVLGRKVIQLQKEKGFPATNTPRELHIEEWVFDVQELYYEELASFYIEITKAGRSR